jgi:hypothetical protein
MVDVPLVRAVLRALPISSNAVSSSRFAAPELGDRPADLAPMPKRPWAASDHDYAVITGAIALGLVLASATRPRGGTGDTAVSTRPVPPGQLWWLVAGFAVCCSALVVFYAVHAIGCAFAWSAGPLRLGLAVVLLAHLIVIGWMWRELAAASPDRGFGQTDTFLHTMVIWTVIAALVATVLTLGPSLLLTICV